MRKSLIIRSFKAVGWILGGVGAIAVLLTALVAAPLTRPPPLASILDTARGVDRSAMPPLERFQARDGTTLAYRHYPARGSGVGRAAIVVHGSSARARASMRFPMRWRARGVETFAVDIRGHGASGARGDIAYLGQLEDDLADFVAVVRKTAPTAPLTLLGHSAGGGFALRVAASSIQDLFARTRAARALSRLRRPDQPAALRRLGQCRHSAPYRAGRAPPDRGRLLRRAACAGLRGAPEFREIPDADLFGTADAQLRYRWRVSRRSRCRDQAAHDLLWNRRRVDGRGSIRRGGARHHAAGRRRARFPASTTWPSSERPARLRRSPTTLRRVDGDDHDRQQAGRRSARRDR